MRRVMLEMRNLGKLVLRESDEGEKRNGDHPVNENREQVEIK
jgi:hypothetical protein